MKLSFDHFSLLSYSAYGEHSVLVMNDGSLKGVGNNDNGQISATLQKTVIDQFTYFSIKDSSSSQLAAVSAVCFNYGTLYMFSKSGGNGRQLVLCDRSINGGEPVFLDIGKHYPVSLFGGCSYLAAIGSEGEVIFINRNSVKHSPNSQIKAVSLPDGEKASSVACCEDSIVVLSSNGRVFSSYIDYGSNFLFFSIVSELSDQRIVCVSGKYEHFLAVSKEGHVFGRGINENGEIGLGERTQSASSFTEILSLEGYKIRAAYAGCNHSLFETQEGKILSCGYNKFSQLLFSSNTGNYVYSPRETTINGGAVFCIAGDNISIALIGSSPPPYTPNMRIDE